MKKNQYIATVACLAAGVIGFASVYATEKAQERREDEKRLAKQEIQISTEKEEETAEKVSSVVPPKETKKTVEDTKTEQETQPSVEQETPKEPEEPVQQTIAEESLHFEEGQELVWPLEGNVILNYSMDSSIYFPTLDQYQYNPAIVIGGDVNSKVYLAAKGKITDISTNEVTGCTVTEDLGDGYSAVYGQLKEVNFEVGDMVEAGQVIGYVSEPTKYFSVEGSNLYFELLKDGKPVNPLDYFQ